MGDDSPIGAGANLIACSIISFSCHPREGGDLRQDGTDGDYRSPLPTPEPGARDALYRPLAFFGPRSPAFAEDDNPIGAGFQPNRLFYISFSCHPREGRGPSGRMGRTATIRLSFAPSNT